MNKKEEEREILELVYNRNCTIIDNINGVATEKPDFDIIGNNERFGVEITKYFYNPNKGASARAHNLGFNYNINKNKDTNFVYPCKIFEKTNEEESWKLLINNAVAYKYHGSIDYQPGQAPIYEDVESEIIDIINEKAKKLKKYRKLNYYELIIFDCEQYFVNHPNIFTDIYKSNNLKYKVAMSGYKRVYIISSTNNMSILISIGQELDKNLKKYSKGFGKDE